MGRSAHGFYRRRGKRLIDFALTLPGVVVLAPLLGATAVCLAVFQGRPVIFRQTRIGLEGRPFTLLKFRTMTTGQEHLGTVSTSVDPRITPIGRWLRKLKIDELPQLLNVLRGDMALVGPRPEVAEYVERLGPDRETVLSVRPGITALSSIKFRDEEALLGAAADPVSLNDEYVYPLKTRLNVWYVRHLSFGLDMLCLAGTAFPALVSGRLDALEAGSAQA
jgi:lipopolysaccharide/colanic/teichoic acid biosynthesis glycosyltransferase